MITNIESERPKRAESGQKTPGPRSRVLLDLLDGVQAEKEPPPTPKEEAKRPTSSTRRQPRPFSWD
jgi:hypothetical protein